MRQLSSSDERSPENSSHACVKILWTGGWDSTFRVLYLSLVEGKRVEPHYIVDTGRPSSLRELRAIYEIKDLLRTSYKEAHDRVSSLRMTLVNEIPEDRETTNSFERLKQRSYLGDQYNYLARYAKSKNLTDLELSVHVDDRVYSFLKGKVEQTQSGGYRLKPRVIGDENIFSRFEFPILEYSKTHMRDIARKHGFIEILEKSWFCHHPMNGIPCGMCNPCAFTVEEGLRYRLPREALFRYHTRHYREAVKSLKAPFLFARRSLSKVKVLRRAYDFLRYGSKN